VAALTASKQQLRKQLQRIAASDTQLGQELKDTQQVVAKEFASLRRHMQLVSTPCQPDRICRSCCRMPCRLRQARPCAVLSFVEEATEGEQ
jgi:hypothetical protein